MAEEQIILCLDMLEERLNIEPRGEGEVEMDIATRIFDISFKVNHDPVDHNVINWLLLHNVDCTSTYQQCIYQMLPAIGDVEMYIKVLFGENDEFLIKEDCMFTPYLYAEVYDSMAREHVACWRAGYFEPEDMSDEELVRHRGYMEYVRAYPV
jgi:hypothetical protein